MTHEDFGRVDEKLKTIANGALGRNSGRVVSSTRIHLPDPLAKAVFHFGRQSMR